MRHNVCDINKISITVAYLQVMKKKLKSCLIPHKSD